MSEQAAAAEPAAEPGNQEELFQFWMLEKLSQIYDLLAVIAASADEKHAKKAIGLHKEGNLAFPAGWRPSDDSEPPNT